MKVDNDSATNGLVITYVPVAELKGAEYNPRKWDKVALGHLKDSITSFGGVSPLIVNSYGDRKGVCIGGHMRLAAFKELGYKEVPVVYVSIPDLELEKELNLRLNSNTGTWDIEKLKTFELDFLTDIGFNAEELSSWWSDTLEVQDDNFNEVKELKKAKQTDIKPGDLFELSNHRLICGSSLDPKVVERLMNGKRADMVNTDMPFNIGLSYDKGVGNHGHYGGTTNDNKTDEEYRVFVKTIMENAIAVSKPDCHYLFWQDERWVWLFQVLYKELGIDSKRLLIWLKNNSSPTPTVAFNKVTEFCCYGTRGRPYLSPKINNLHEVMNKGITTGNSVSEEVLDLLNVWMVKRLPSNQLGHPTQKCPSLHDKALRRCTKPGDIVLDLTAGSGSILIACEQLKRVAYVSDYEPVFCQLIINRFEALTGLKAKKINGSEKE